MGVAAKRRPINESKPGDQESSSSKTVLHRAEYTETSRDKDSDLLQEKERCGNADFSSAHGGATNWASELVLKVKSSLKRIETNQQQKSSPSISAVSEAIENLKVIHFPRKTIKRSLRQTPYISSEQSNQTSDDLSDNQNLEILAKGNRVKLIFMVVIPLSFVSFMIGARIAFVILTNSKMGLPELIWRSINFF